ncbi:MAG: hypothetical protein M1830_007268, partial [Pleopsidium flavum]
MDEEKMSIEDDALRNYLPTSFGKQSKEANVAAQINRTKRTTADLDGAGQNGILGHAQDAARESEPDEDEGDDDSDEHSDVDDEFPVSHELVLKTHDRAITTVTVDPSGSRLITGSNDCTIKLHDFASMTPTTLRAFKSVDPTVTKASSNSETHPVHHVEFNPISP